MVADSISQLGFHSSRHAMVLTLGQIVESDEERTNVALSQGFDEWTCLCQGRSCLFQGAALTQSTCSLATMALATSPAFFSTSSMIFFRDSQPLSSHKLLFLLGLHEKRGLDEARMAKRFAQNKKKNIVSQVT